MVRRNAPGQMDLFGAAPTPEVKSVQQFRRTKSGKLAAPDFYESLSMKDLLLEQIRRDVDSSKTDTDPWWRDFHAKRAEQFKQQLKEMMS